MSSSYFQEDEKPKNVRGRRWCDEICEIFVRLYAELQPYHDQNRPYVKPDSVIFYQQFMTKVPRHLVREYLWNFSIDALHKRLKTFERFVNKAMCSNGKNRPDCRSNLVKYYVPNLDYYMTLPMRDYYKFENAFLELQQKPTIPTITLAGEQFIDENELDELIKDYH